MRRRQDFTDANALEALAEHVTVDRVAVAREVGGGGVAEGVHDRWASRPWWDDG